MRDVVIADAIRTLINRAGGAGQKSAFPRIKEDLWDAAQNQISMDMPESHEKAERGQMAEDGLAGASPEDQTTFPSNVEDQVPPARPGLALTASQSWQPTLPGYLKSSRDCLSSSTSPAPLMALYKVLLNLIFRQRTAGADRKQIIFKGLIGAGGGGQVVLHRSADGGA